MQRPEIEWSDQLALEAGVARLVFSRAGDRYAHRLEVGASSRVVFSSIEGTPDEEWPASPALQELHEHVGADGMPVALLVGMAGKSHWSLTAQVRLIDEISVRAEFDVACRASRTPTLLGSEYALAEALSSVAVLSSEATGCQIREAPDRLRFDVARTAIGGPTTYRWRYALSLKLKS